LLRQPSFRTQLSAQQEFFAYDYFEICASVGLQVVFVSAPQAMVASLG
jgi:hypothetical protein